MQKLPSLYLITDRHQVPDGKAFLNVLEELLAAGVRMLQLREKDLPAAELLPLARQVRQLTKAHNCLMLINDRVDLVLATGADGVHLGNHSMPASVAREILGPDRLIGVSTHRLEEIPRAEQQGANFITFGPVYLTPSKAAYGEPVGLQALSQACSRSSLPVYGLGGINRHNAAQVMQSGASGIALISALLSAISPADGYRQLSSALGS